jgi:hypothetical protein
MVSWGTTGVWKRINGEKKTDGLAILLIYLTPVLGRLVIILLNIAEVLYLVSLL